LVEDNRITKDDKRIKLYELNGSPYFDSQFAPVVKKDTDIGRKRSKSKVKDPYPVGLDEENEKFAAQVLADTKEEVDRAAESKSLQKDLGGRKAQEASG
jgi:hypothetical protein